MPSLKLCQSICLYWVRPCILCHNMVHVFPQAQRRQTLRQQAFQNQGEVTRFFRKSEDEPLSRQKIEILNVKTEDFKSRLKIWQLGQMMEDLNS